MDVKYSKNIRILDMYQRLLAGKILNKTEDAQRFNVDVRSIQRDIDDIRAFLAEQNAAFGESREIVYDRRQKGFRMEGYASPLMTNSEILAVSKILLESRAFTKAEMSAVLDKLISGCVPRKSMKLVSDLLANEKFHYMELTNPVGIQEKLWDIGTAIQQRRLLQIRYYRQGEDLTSAAERIVEPQAILFSEYYFYLNAYIVETSGGQYTHKYEFPAVYRVDRIAACRITEKSFTLPYAGRFQEGEFRKRVQFMTPGKLQVIRIRYTGASVDAILDRLPTAKIIGRDGVGILIEAEVYGNGVIMWLLSQGERVEVLAPKELRRKMCETLQNILAHYLESPVAM